MKRLGATLVLLAATAGCLEALIEETPTESVPPPTSPNKTCPRVAFEADGDPDRSLEEIAFRINDTEPFTVLLPLPVADPETSAQAWARNVTVRGGEGSATLATSTRGRVLRVTGLSSLIVCSTSLQPARGGNGCCAETYLDASWTTNPTSTRPETVSVQIVEGSPDIHLAYAAQSSWCGRNAEFSESKLSVGWHSVSGSDSAWCE